MQIERVAQLFLYLQHLAHGQLALWAGVECDLGNREQIVAEDEAAHGQARICLRLDYDDRRKRAVALFFGDAHHHDVHTGAIDRVAGDDEDELSRFPVGYGKRRSVDVGTFGCYCSRQRSPAMRSEASDHS